MNPFAPLEFGLRLRPTVAAGRIAGTAAAGVRVAAAPNFHIPGGLPPRLRINGGVEADGGRVVARGEWRPAGAEEIARLVSTDAEAATRAADDQVLLFRLPDHLMASWWAMLERSAGAPADLDPFAAAVAEFLAFKELPVPAGAEFRVVVGAGGGRSANWGARVGRPAGLAHNPARWGGINLGDEPCSLLFANPPSEPGSDGAGRDDADPARRLLARRPDCPVVSLTLHPGEGCRLPRGLLFDGLPPAAAEADVHLVVDAPTE